MSRMKDNYKRGKASELYAAAKLSMMGFEVYSQIAGTHTYDLLLFFNKSVFTVEVKTDEKLKVRPYMFKNKADLLALCDYTGNVRLVPVHPTLKLIKEMY